jgi:hypothetical protein
MPVRARVFIRATKAFKVIIEHLPRRWEFCCAAWCPLSTVGKTLPEQEHAFSEDMFLLLLPDEISRRNSTQPFGARTWPVSTQTRCPNLQILLR